MPERIDVRGIEERDLPALARFYRDESPETPAGDPLAHLHWYFFENPHALPDVPPGWIGLDGEGRIVGAKHCVCQRFRYGDESFPLLLGGGFYVKRQHRGLGMLLMRRYLSLSDRWSHFATTMNAISGAIYERHGGYPIAGSEHELIGVLHWAPVLEEVLFRRLGSAPAARALAAAGALRPAAVRGTAQGTLTRIDAAREAEELGLALPPEHAKQLTALRDPDFLRWRYFEGPDPTRSLYVYEARAGRCLVGVALRARGHRRQARTLLVLDLWGSLPPDAVPDVTRALAQRHRHEADLLVLRGQSRERERALERAGFVSRALPRAAGVCIDRAGRLPTRDWYLVPADGDTGH